MWCIRVIQTLKNSSRFNATLNWRLCSKVTQIQRTKQLITSEFSRFPTKKFNKSVFFYTNIGLGIGCGFALNCIKVDCEGTKRIKNAVSEGENNPNNVPNFDWGKFFQLLKPYWLQFFGALAAALGCALMNILVPKALGNLLEVLSQASGDHSHILEDIKNPVKAMLVYCTIQSVLTFWYISLLSEVAEGIARTMKVRLFSSMMNQDIAFFDKNRTGELVNRLTVDVHDFKSSFKIVISQGLRSITQVIGCSISLLHISPQMTGVMMLVVPTAIIFGTFAGSLLRKISFESKAQTAVVTLAAEEAISNIRTVRSFAMEDVEKEILETQIGKSNTLEVRLGRSIAVFQGAAQLFLNGLLVTTIYYGGYMIKSGSITSGGLMAFLIAVQILQRSFSQLAQLFGIFIKGIHAGARVFEMMDLPPGVDLNKGKIIPHDTLVPEVELRNVNFSYPTRPGHEVLKNVNLKIPAHSTVAIVGPSGSGKSTMAWLIERLYDVNSGTVLVGGENVQDLNPSWLRSQVIGFISQEPLLFATTVTENIRFGRPEATDKEVMEAAKLANADEFIQKFPDGYQTKVGERGAAVSGGQRQRIAIARALLKNPSILILDEATSALDAESEKLVQKALDCVMKSRTTIVIAHRLSTIINADMIVVLQDGEIIQMGKHHELMQKKGLYASLVAQQVSS